jgi:hypothetical protein
MLLPVFFLLTAGFAHAGTVFVSATAAPGGDGSQQKPFNSLAAVERVSAPGDEIVVLASPISAPPLDGGIALKPHQKLTGHGPSVTDGTTLTQAARITNSSAATNSGDAVVLADYAEVSNLVILNSYRGGIYGSDVTEVDIHDNNLSGTNTSCTPGFYVYFPVNNPSLANAWAAIMVDEDTGTRSVGIRNNYIHDGACNDGIDVRTSGTAIVMARVSHNNITHLLEGPKVRSLLGIGMQTRETAVLTVESDYNSETYIGSPTADCEGLFTNQAGGSLTWNINHNTFAHGIGGGSCNGGEFFLSSGPSTMNVYVSHSTFEDDPGDMIEEINEATASTINLTLEDVTVKHTTHPAPPFPPETQFAAGAVNRGRCVAQSSHGHQNSNNLRVMDSHFSDCVGDGIGSAANGGNPFTPPPASAAAGSGAVAGAAAGSGQGARGGAGGGVANGDFGDGVGDSMSIDIENTTITGTQQDAFHFMNLVPLKEVTIRLENNQFGDAQGPAVVAIDQNASTERSEIDLGGKAPDSSGGNCIIAGGTLGLEVTGYDVTAKSNWWGRPEGPLPTKTSITSGNLNFEPALRQPPSTCKGTK